MRITFLFFILLCIHQASAQLVASLQPPPAGLVHKPQLWSMALTNTTNAPISVHIELVLSEATTGNQVLTGATGSIILNPGTTQVNGNQLMPIQYNVANPSYNIDASPFGILPVGSFEACFSFFKHQGDAVQEIADQCQEILVEPLGPPQLVYPYDQTAIEELLPNFVWLPPVPLSLFSNLNYDFTLVEISPNQSAADAIQQNVPLYQQQSISINSMLYPQSAAALEAGKQYAWRISAKSNAAVVGQSETWQFSIRQFAKGDSTSKGGTPYVRLKKDPEGGYALFAGVIKFDYYNETADSTWNYRLYDLSTAQRNTVAVPLLDTLELRPGHNLVQYDASGNSGFTDRHIYLLEVKNSRNETWRMMFEYRRPNDQD
jgi:hypothetical protein